MSSAPFELLSDIFLRLAFKDLIRCMCVCKAWNATIRHQLFIKAHFEHSSIQTNSDRTHVIRPHQPTENFFSVAFYDGDDNDHSFGCSSGSAGRAAVRLMQPLNQPPKYDYILGYCHGLLCIHTSGNKHFAFWNPSIQKFKKIPKMGSYGFRYEYWYDSVVAYGFGYDSTNDDHRLVRMVQFTNRVNQVIVSSQVKVYNLKSNSWKRIQNLPHNHLRLPLGSNGLFLKGALNFLMVNALNENRFIVLTLDLASEKYMEFPTPVDRVDGSRLEFHVLGGRLCICVYHFYTRHDVWIMKEYGVTESWTMLYSIHTRAFSHIYDNYCIPLVFSKSGKKFLLKQDHNMLFWYDLKKKRIEPVEIDGMPTIAYHSFDTAIWVRNLYLLDADPVILGNQVWGSSIFLKVIL